MKFFEDKHLLLFPYILILGVALLRLEISHAYNFVPVFSCLLLFAAMRPMREFALPLLALVGVDIFLTTHLYGYPLTFGSAITWVWYLIVMLLGSGILRNFRSWRRVAGCSLLAAVSFFLVSNYAVWAEWSMYPKTLGGLGTCYIAALPFFRNSLISEFFFSMLLFGLFRHARALTAVEIAQEAQS